MYHTTIISVKEALIMDEIKAAVQAILEESKDDAEVRAYLAGFAACLRLRGDPQTPKSGEVA